MHRLLPQFIQDQYQAGNYHGEFQAIGLLVDVSGFSHMTDVLAQHGLHGSEVLANGMRQVFDPMIQSVIEHGGFVVGFAGDAITALFPTRGTIEETHNNAITSALRIQDHRAKNAGFVTPYGEFDIFVKIGLGAGNARWNIVNATDGRRATYYFHGSAIDNAVRSLSLAKPGELILCPNLSRALRNSILDENKGEYILLRRYTGSLAAPVEIDLPQPDPDLLKVFCSEEVSSHDHSGEFRPAVNLFIDIAQDSFEEIQLEQFLQQVFRLQDRYGGLFSRVDSGDKGTNLLMFWGAPFAQENDVERALNFFLELRKETGAPIKAGITYRLAYAGYMGGALQEEYTCYGWGVNLSARLMMAAGTGEIWADEEIARRADRRFSFQYVGQQTFKGFSQEQSVFKLLRRREDDWAVFQGKFVGRESELETLRKFISPIWSGGFAGILTVVGEPGIGKSRLMYAFQTSELFTKNKVHWATCQTDEIIRQSLNPFRYWLKRYFNVSETSDETGNKLAFDKRLDALIASIPDEELSRSLNRRRSFLGELVDLHWPDSLYERLDAEGRYENTFIALSALLRGESLQQPLVILIEDTHLLDNDTKEFLAYLERALTAEVDKSYPIALLATSRHEGQVITFQKAPSKEIDLSELPKAELIRLAEFLLGGTIAPSFLEILAQRTEGNPFFTEQIIRYMQEERQLEQGRQGWQVASNLAIDALPTDISAILISRLDRLNREVREVVQTAAVLGREFELRLLSKMLHDDENLPEKIGLAVQADILSALTEIRYIFRHALLRDAAYNMQLRARQRELHQIAVEAFETLYQDQLSPHYSEIAYHAEQAGLLEKAKKFYILAGAGAAQAYQNYLAIDSYTRALALSSLDDIQERIDLLLARVALYRTIGDRAGQEQDLATLELLAEKQKNARNRAIVALQQVHFAFDAGAYQEAQRFSQNAIEIAESVGALDIVASTYRTLPLALARQGQIQQAIQFAQTGLQVTQQVGDRESEGQTFNELGLIMLEQRDPARARAYFEKSLALAQETGNRRMEAQVLNNMGNISGMIEGDYSTARGYYERTLMIVREIGNRVGESYALGNLGWVASMQGDFGLAQIYQQESLTLARETGNLYQETYGTINLSAMLVSQENYSGARQVAEQALKLAPKLGDRSAEAWAWTYLGHANLGAGNHRDAMIAYQKALEIRYTLEQPTLAMEPLAGQAQTALESGDPRTALAHIEPILAHLANGGDMEGTEEPLRVYLTMYLTLHANQDPRADQILERAYSLLQEQVNHIQGQQNQEMFVRNVPWRREIATHWQQKKGTR